MPNASATTPLAFGFDQTEFLLFSSGKSLEETLTLKNYTDQTTEIVLKWLPYSEDSSKVIKQDFLTKHSIDFAQLPETKISLEPFDSKILNITFSVPKDLSSGDYYGSLVAVNGKTEARVKFTLRVLGKLTETIECKAYFSKDKLNIDVSNLGNRSTQMQVSTRLNSITAPVTNQAFPQMQLSAGEVVALQTDSLRLLPGYYQATIDIKYSENNTEKVLIVSFWVHPEVFIISLLTLLLSIAGFIYFRNALKPNV